MKKRNLRTSSSLSGCPQKRSKRQITRCQSRWASLPEEILVTIAELLTAPDGVDFVRFGAVCTSWHSAAACSRFTLVRQMPWVMLPPADGATETQVFNPSENKLYRLPLPEARWTSLCGSVKGWVATQEDDCRIHLHNLNPFTCQPRRHILPSLREALDCLHSAQARQHPIWKLCLPSSPTEDPKGIAVALYGCGHRLAFARLGSRAWTTINCSSGWTYDDVVSYKGSFYATGTSGDVMKLNLQQRKTVKIASGPTEEFYERHLVESAGDLLQVVKCPGKRMKIFKLHFMTREWEVVTTLGERSLFLSLDSYSISVSAPQLFGCRSNCVYFINDDYRNEDGEYAIHDLLVYSLEEDKLVERQDMGQTCEIVDMRPLWVSPYEWWKKS